MNEISEPERFFAVKSSLNPTFENIMRSYISKTVGTVLFLFLPLFAGATALDQLKNFSTNAHSARGEFSQAQVKSGEKVRFTNAASGTFLFSRPGKFIWTYKKPYEQVLQADGTRLYMYDKDLNQVTVKKLGDALGSSPAAILFGSNNLEKNFTLKNAGAHNGYEWVEVIPKKKDTPFEKINIGMKNGIPEAMELYDSLGQLTLIKFTRFTKNPPVNAGMFKFVAPKGADVFEN